jgi:hypothetical protein
MSAGVNRMMIITHGCDCRHSYMASENLICYVCNMVLNSSPQRKLVNNAVCR